MIRRSRAAVLVALATVVALASLAFPKAATFAKMARAYGLGAVIHGAARRITARGGPSVAWDGGAPEDQGFSPSALDSLTAALAERSTAAFLVARNGKLIHEWYEPGRSPNTPHATAALAKAVVGSMILLSLAADGVVALDDRAAQHIPVWLGRSQKDGITLRELASHASGLDDVYFPPAAEADAWFAGQPAWKRRYFDHPEERFAIALSEVPLIYPPGTAHRYSGIGYYVLSYAMSSALHARAGGDFRHWLARRVYGPMGIPITAWQISYGDAYRQDGLTLFAIGSGASLTPRALARIGQTVLDQWGGPTFAPLRSPGVPGSAALYTLPEDSAGVLERALPHLGWWGNDQGAWPSLPSDALVGIGANDQIVLVAPSLRLVAVRVGGSLSGKHRSARGEAILDEAVFGPLVRALR